MSAPVNRHESRVLGEWMAKRRIEKAIASAVRAPLRKKFDGADADRLTASLSGTSLAVNADLDHALVVLRSRARHLADNTDHGRRFLSLVATNIVGPFGPTLQVRARDERSSENPQPLDRVANDLIEGAWSRWGKQCDVRARMSFPILLRVLVKAVARDGEALVRRIADRSVPGGFRLQLLEADRLDEMLNGVVTRTGNQVRQGVEMDGNGRPVAYHIKLNHPGESWLAKTGRNETERVPAAQIYHVYLPERAEQVRGYTWFHAVIRRSGLLHKFNEAAVVAATVGAQKMGVFTRGLEAADDALKSLADDLGQDGNQLHMSAEAGEFIELPPGYDLKTWDPKYPDAAYADFVNACMRGIAAGLDVAAHNLSGDMTDVNYSSARIAELSERDMWKALQQWLLDMFVGPMFEEWLAGALARGDIVFTTGRALPADRLPKFLEATKWVPRVWQWVDPEKEANAKRALLDMGVTSRTRIAAEEGVEFDDVVAELSDEARQLAAAGISAAAAPSATTTSTGTQPAPK